MQKRRQPETIAGRVNSDGSIAAGDGFTVQKTGTGAFTITFSSGFRLIALTASFGGGSFATGVLYSSERVALVSGFSSTTGAAADGSFNFVAVGVQQ